MRKFTGIVRRSDLEGGHLQLQAEDGTVYELETSEPLADGDHVEIEGTVEKATMSIAMTGPRLKVKAIRRK